MKSFLKLSLLVVLATQAKARLSERNFTRQTQEAEDPDELIPVLIGYKETGNKRLIARIVSRIRSRYTRVNAVSASIKRSELDELADDPDVLYVEEDPLVYPDGETELYGLDMVQAFSSVIPAVSLDASSACNDPNSFKIGVIDSGLAVNHPDIPCLPIDQSNTNCIGREFMSTADGVWYDPQVKFHGTHVAGTIGASGLNQNGVQGVVNDGTFCFLIGRVFGESGTASSMSNVFDAVEWMLDNGVNVINMSLGGASATTTGRLLFNAARSQNAIMVAAAGNGGGSDMNYPASYNNVLSVAAVDKSLKKASFSQYNSMVDISAPGVDILSTFPLTLGGEVILTSASVAVTGAFMRLSVTKDIQGKLVECPNLGQDKCPGSGGHICLIERGAIKFEAKTLNCEAGGGIGAVIYNNVDGDINGGLSNPTATSVPVLEITAADGLLLMLNALGKTLKIENKKGYGTLSGTSMAVPHVTGVISKIWRACPSCSSDEVTDCVLETAIDLGDSGRDDLYGNGLIQAGDAFECLVNTIQCCSVENPPEPTPSPTASPTPSPTAPPVNNWDGSLQSMQSAMQSLEFLKAEFTNGSISASQLATRLTDILHAQVTYQSFYNPSAAVLSQFFEARRGISDLVQLYQLEKTYIDKNTQSIDQIASWDNVFYYTITEVVSFFDLQPVTIECLVKMTFGSEGRIKNIVTSIDAQAFEAVYSQSYGEGESVRM